MLAFRWSERDQKRPTRTSLHTDPVLPPGVDTVLSVLRSSAVVLDEADAVVKASSAAYALGLVRGGKLAVEPMLQMARDTRRDGEIRQVELDLPRRGTGRGEALAVSARVAPARLPPGAAPRGGPHRGPPHRGGTPRLRRQRQP